MSCFVLVKPFGAYNGGPFRELLPQCTAGNGGGDTRITVAERESGKAVARYTPKDFSGGKSFLEFALDAEGNVAALSGRQPPCDLHCLAVRNVDGGPVRQLTKKVYYPTVALAGGRVAYLTKRHVVVTDLDGDDARRFDRFESRHRGTGEIALTSNRVAWATAEGRSGEGPRGTVRSAPLPPR